MTAPASPTLPLDHVARLARLELSPEQREKFAQQLGSVLEHVARLEAVDTTRTVAVAHARPLRNVFREDCPESSMARDLALQSAPETRDACFAVPRVVGES